MSLCEHGNIFSHCADCSRRTSSEQRPDIIDQMYDKEHGRPKEKEQPTPRQLLDSVIGLVPYDMRNAAKANVDAAIAMLVAQSARAAVESAKVSDLRRQLTAERECRKRTEEMLDDTRLANAQLRSELSSGEVRKLAERAGFQIVGSEIVTPATCMTLKLERFANLARIASRSQSVPPSTRSK